MNAEPTAPAPSPHARVWDTAAFRREMEALCRARNPLIYVVTHEEDRALNELRSVGEKLFKTVVYWSASKGIWTDKPHDISRHKTAAHSDFAVALEMFEQHAEHDPGMLFVLLDPHPYLADKNASPIYRRRLRDLAIGIRTRNFASNCVIVSPNLSVPYELEKETTIVNFPLPTREEIRAFVEDFLAMVKSSKKVTVEGDSELVEALVNASIGLSFTEVKSALARAVVDDRRIDLKDVSQVFRLKQQIIRKNGILEYIDTRDWALDQIGGLETLKTWLVERGETLSDAARAFGIPTPKGVLLTGVPGCGKSLSAKCIATAYGLPLVRLDMGKIYSSFIGSSEERMRTAIDTCEAVAPCVLWIDEIEKGLPRTSNHAIGDSGVSLRVFGTFLTWLQEKTAAVFVVATANQIDLLSPEMMRKGRFDEIFFVDLPHREERREILSIHIRRVRRDPAKLDMEELLRLSGPENFGPGIGMTGAEIEAWVNDALIHCFHRRLQGPADSPDLAVADFAHVAKSLVPLARLRQEEIAAMREWANTHALSASQLPADAPRNDDFAISGRRLDLP